MPTDLIRPFPGQRDSISSRQAQTSFRLIVQPESHASFIDATLVKQAACQYHLIVCPLRPIVTHRSPPIPTLRTDSVRNRRISAGFTPKARRPYPPLGRTCPHLQSDLRVVRSLSIHKIYYGITRFIMFNGHMEVCLDRKVLVLIAARVLVWLYPTERRRCVKCCQNLTRFSALNRYDILFKKRFR